MAGLVTDSAYHIEKKCHVPAVSFDGGMLASQEDADNLAANYCLMQKELFNAGVKGIQRKISSELQGHRCSLPIEYKLRDDHA